MKKDEFKVSVIIPVYNCEAYIVKAIDSALEQEEVFEVILIEDKSPDNALQICKEYVIKYKDRVKLFQHKNFENKGAAESRNLGVKKSKCSYIAFLDADDYYLENRFKRAKKIFEENSNVDGVYEAVETFFYSEEAKNNWLNLNGPLLTTITENIEPKHLFAEMSPNGNKGWFHCNGLTLKKSIFSKIGYFDNRVNIVEDTLFFLKLASEFILLPGDIVNPVAIRGVHNFNRVTDDSVRVPNTVKMYVILSLWSIFNLKPRWKTKMFLNSLSVAINGMKRDYGNIISYRYKLLTFILLKFKIFFQK